jgi:hypothetical protein
MIPTTLPTSAATTAQGILSAEFSRRSGYLALDSDLSAVLPDHPANTFTPVYDGFTLEEILHDLMGALGDGRYGCEHIPIPCTKINVSIRSEGTLSNRSARRYAPGELQPLSVR